MRNLALDPARWPIPPPEQLLTHHAKHLLSRRSFMASAAGVAGAALGTGLFPVNALAARPSPNATPKPTAQTVTLNGVTFQLSFFGPGVDPSSIGDFNGFVGVADVQGTGTATNPDGSTETLLFDTDMRFMSGVYVGVDGAVHKGTFGFIWLDLYRGQYDLQNFSTQVHDFDPGINPYPDGLFWTVATPAVGRVELGTGRAHMSAANVALEDYFDIPNALFRFEVPPSVPATCSFDINWTGPVSSRGPVTTPGSEGQLVMTAATMTWSASNALGFSFVSNPSGTTSVFAQLGHVRNGVFVD
jgi:hypothetical protein